MNFVVVIVVTVFLFGFKSGGNSLFGLVDLGLGDVDVSVVDPH